MKNRINKLFILFLSCMLLLSTNVYAEDTLKLCERSGSLRVFQFIGNMINVAKIAVPLIIIIYSSKDIIKAVINGSADNIKELATTFVRRVVSGMVVFLVPALVYVGLNIANTAAKREAITTEFSQCNACIVGDDACKGYISAAEAMEEQEAEEDKAKRQSGDKNPVPSLTVDPGGSGDSGSGSGNIQTGSHDGYVLVGDSRTYAYGDNKILDNGAVCYYIYSSENTAHASSPSSQNIDNIDVASLSATGDICFGTVSGQLRELKGYHDDIINYLKAHSDNKYTVSYNFGVNDIVWYVADGDNESTITTKIQNRAKEYINEYSAQVQEIKSINSGNKVLFVSVNPVSSSGVGKITNSRIEVFNNYIKSNLPSGMSYCNTYSMKDELIKNLSSDGLHFNKTGNSLILNYIKTKC